MPYVEVDVDMDDLDTHDLVEELVKRFKSFGYKKRLDDADKKELRQSIIPLLKELKQSPFDGLEIKTIDDQRKIEHIVSVFTKYSPSEIEKRLP